MPKPVVKPKLGLINTSNKTYERLEPPQFMKFGLWQNPKNTMDMIVIAGAWLASLQNADVQKREADYLKNYFLHAFSGVAGEITGEDKIQMYNYLVRNPEMKNNPVKSWEAVCLAYRKNDVNFDNFPDKIYGAPNHHTYLAVVRAGAYAATRGLDESELKRTIACWQCTIKQEGNGSTVHSHKGDCLKARFTHVEAKPHPTVHAREQPTVEYSTDEDESSTSEDSDDYRDRAKTTPRVHATYAMHAPSRTPKSSNSPADSTKGGGNTHHDRKYQDRPSRTREAAPETSSSQHAQRGDARAHFPGVQYVNHAHLKTTTSGAQIHTVWPAHIQRPKDTVQTTKTRDSDRSHNKPAPTESTPKIKRITHYNVGRGDRVVSSAHLYQDATEPQSTRYDDRVLRSSGLRRDTTHLMSNSSSSQRDERSKVCDRDFRQATQDYPHEPQASRSEVRYRSRNLEIFPSSSSRSHRGSISRDELNSRHCDSPLSPPHHDDQPSSRRRSGTHSRDPWPPYSSRDQRDFESRSPSLSRHDTMSRASSRFRQDPTLRSSSHSRSEPQRSCREDDGDRSPRRGNEPDPKPRRYDVYDSRSNDHKGQGERRRRKNSRTRRR